MGLRGGGGKKSPDRPTHDASNFIHSRTVSIIWTIHRGLGSSTMLWSVEYMFVGKQVVIRWTTLCTSASVALQSAKHSRYSSINFNCCKVWAKEISTDSWAFIVFTNALTYLHLEIFQSFYNLVILIQHCNSQARPVAWYHSLSPGQTANASLSLLHCAWSSCWPENISGLVI